MYASLYIDPAEAPEEKLLELWDLLGDHGVETDHVRLHTKTNPAHQPILTVVIGGGDRYHDDAWTEGVLRVARQVFPQVFRVEQVRLVGRATHNPDGERFRRQTHRRPLGQLPKPLPVG